MDSILWPGGLLGLGQPVEVEVNRLNDQILVLSNLWNAGAKGGDGHYCKESAILTCATIKKTPGVDLANGTSMDQLAAQRLGEQTPLPSLELGIAPVAVGVDLAGALGWFWLMSGRLAEAGSWYAALLARVMADEMPPPMESAPGPAAAARALMNPNRLINCPFRAPVPGLFPMFLLWETTIRA